MTTDLATIASQVPAYLQQNAPKTTDEFSGGIAASFPLPFLSIRGKEFRLRKDGQEMATGKRELQMVFVAARSTLSKRLYDKKYVSGTIEAPVCSSANSITPNVADPVAPACQTCPKNQWGSRITEAGKQGKECQDYKRIIVWLVGYSDTPMVLDIPATSLKAPKGQKHSVLMLGDFLGQLAKHGMDPTQVVATVSFTDAEYPQLCFDFNRFATEDEFAKVLELRASDDVRTVLDEDAFEAPGEIKETPVAPAAPAAPAAPKPEVPEFPGSSTVMKRGDEFTIAEDAESWEKAYLAGYRPAQMGSPQKAAEPEPEPPKAEEAAEPPKAEEAAEPPKAEEAAADSSDFLNEIAKLLGT
jgi:hypothetical protein